MSSQVQGAEVQVRHVSYANRLDERSVSKLNMVVIHATETPDLRTARELAEVIHYSGSQTGNSGHYYVDVDGQVYEYVPITRVAHHVVGHNKHSIGIELVNRGRYPHWFDADYQQWTAPYPEEQVQALAALLQTLMQRYPSINVLARHSDLDLNRVPAADDATRMIRRKLDPGATFPWQWLLETTGLAAYSEPSE